MIRKVAPFSLAFILAACAESGSSPAPGGGLGSGDSTASASLAHLCAPQQAIPASCRVGRDGQPYVETCQVDGFEARQYTACGHGIHHYRSYLCQQPGITEAVFNRIQCVENPGVTDQDLSLSSCEQYQTSCTLNAQAQPAICHVPGSSFPKQEYACDDPVTGYRAYLCRVYTTTVTAAQLEQVSCDAGSGTPGGSAALAASDIVTSAGKGICASLEPIPEDCALAPDGSTLFEICSVAKAPDIGEKEFTCGRAVAKFKHFLCQTHPQRASLLNNSDISCRSASRP